MTEKISCVKIFPLILPKKHNLITQKRFWPFFGVFSGFLGSPRTLYFRRLSLLSISDCTLEYLDVCKFMFLNEPVERGLFCLSAISRLRPKDSRPSVHASVRTCVRPFVKRLLGNCSLLFLKLYS